MDEIGAVDILGAVVLCGSRGFFPTTFTSLHISGKTAKRARKRMDGWIFLFLQTR